MSYLVSLTSESGTSLSHTTTHEAFVLLHGQHEYAGSIFGPYSLESAHRLAAQAKTASDPYRVLKEFEESGAGRFRKPVPTLVNTSRF